MNKIYQVEIVITYADSFENYFETYLFEEREKAMECVNHLFVNLFKDDGLTYSVNPFNGYDEEEQEEYVKVNLTYEDGALIKFGAYDKNDNSSVEVSISEKAVNTPKDKWEF